MFSRPGTAGLRFSRSAHFFVLALRKYDAPPRQLSQLLTLLVQVPSKHTMADGATGLSGAEVKLISSDEREFPVASEVASMSITIKNMLDGSFPVPSQLLLFLERVAP